MKTHSDYAANAIFISALLLGVTLFFSVPFDIAAHNAALMQATLVHFTFFGLCGVLGFAAFGWGISKLFKNEWALKIIAVIFVSVASFAWINSTFMVGAYGEISGRGLKIYPYAYIASMQLRVLALIIILSAITMFKKPVFPAGIVKVFLLIATIGALVNAGVFISKEGKIWRDTLPVPKTLLSLSPKANILHIVFDEFQTEYFKQNLEQDPSLKAALDGFIFYTDAAANFPTTAVAVPAMLSGKIFMNDHPWLDFTKELAVQKETVPQKLKEAGYDDTAFVPYCTFYPFFSGCTEDMLPKKRLGFYLSILDLSLFRATPDRFKNNVYREEQWLLSSWFRKALEVDSFGKRLEDYKRIANMLTVEPTQKPTYKYIHTVLTHAPGVYDKKCNPLEKVELNTIDVAVSQGACALSIFKQLLERLKQQGIYDQTLIILSADHGSGYKGDDFQYTSIPYYKARPTLLIKPFNSKGALKENTYMAQLSDLPDTIYGVTKLPLTNTGVDLLAANKPPRVGRMFHSYEWTEEYHHWGQAILPPYTTYNIVGPTDDFRSWQLFDIEMAKRDFVPTTCGTEWGMSKEETNNYFTARGLSYIEPWGRWAEAKMMAFKFPVQEQNGCLPSKLTLKLQAFFPAENYKQNAELWLNRQKIGEIHMAWPKAEASVTVNIPKDLFKTNEPNLLSFDFPQAVAPASLKLTSDLREMSMGFISVKFE